MTKKLIINTENPNGTLVDLTAEEEAQRVTDLEQSEIESAANTEAREQLATNKASAKAKLIAGEALTEAEADTIVL